MANSPKRSGEPSTLGDVLARLIPKLRLQESLWTQDLAQEWPTLVGVAVAAHARPGRVTGNVLTVYVDSSAWLNELARFGHRQMLANIRKRFGPGRIAELRFRLDPGR